MTPPLTPKTLARHVAMKPSPMELIQAVGKSIMELILPDTKISQDHDDALGTYLNEFSQHFWLRTGCSSTLNMNQVKDVLEDIARKSGALNAALDNLDPSINLTLKGAYNFLNKQTGLLDYARTIGHIADLERKVTSARNGLENNLPGSFSRTDDFYITGHLDAADVQHWAAYKIIEFVDIFTNHTGTVRNSAEIAACLLPYFDCRFGRALFQYRDQLNDAVLATGNDPIKLAQIDPSGKALLAVIPRGHNVLESRPQIRGMEWCPFEFSAETGEILGSNIKFESVNDADRRDQTYQWFKNSIARADKYYLKLKSDFKNQERALHGWHIDRKNPTAIYALSLAAQGVYRLPAQQIKTELIHSALAIIYFQGQDPAPVIVRAELEWRDYMDCLNELRVDGIAETPRTQSALAYLRAFRRKVAEDVPTAYLKGHNLIIPEIEEVRVEWVNSHANDIPRELG